MSTFIPVGQSNHPSYNVLNQHVGNYYYHVLPGNKGKSGDRNVSWAQKGMGTPSYQKFERAHDTYLSTMAVNLVILAATLTIITHFALVVTSKKKFNYSTLDDMFNGPVLQIIIAGLVGVGLLLGHLGISHNLYYALYIPFGIIVMSVGLWALFDVSAVDPFDLPSFGEFTNFAPESIIWILIALLVMAGSAVQWMRGNMRLDAMTSSSAGTFFFICMCVLFAYGLSRVFALVIRTLDHFKVSNGNRNGLLFFLSYAFASMGMVVMIVASVKFLDTALTFVGGHFHTVFAPPIGVGASKAIMETQRAFQMCIYTVVFMSAALMWRSRNGLIEGSENDDDIRNEWLGLSMLFIMVPIIAVISEGVKRWVELYGPVYDLFRAIVLGSILVYVGTGFVPWNYVTLGAAAAITVFMSLRYLEIQEDWDKPASALLCVGFFVLGKMAFRGFDIYLRQPSPEDMKRASEKDKQVRLNEQVDTGKEWLSWLWYMVFPAFLLVLITAGYYKAEHTHPGYGGHLFRIYFAFIMFYSMSLTIVDKSNRVSTINDSPFYDLVPENEAASLAIDGTILMACLMVTTAIWKIIIPEKYGSGGFIKLVAGYIIIGLGCTYLYINVRHDRAISTFARERQKETEKWYSDISKDIRAG